MAEYPSSIPAEQSLLGLMIKNRSSIQAASEEGLTAEDFYVPKNQIIYRTIMSMDQEGQMVDLASLATRLQDQHNLEKIGGMDYLLQIIDQGDSAEKNRTYIDLIRNKSLLRQLIKATDDIRNDAMNNSYKEWEVLSKADTTIRKITEARQRSAFKSTKELTGQVVDMISELKEKGKTTGVKTGFPYLDRNTNGFQAGEMIILAARTAVGKTAFSINLAINAAIRTHKCVAMFTLEMTAEQYIMRMLAMEGRIPSNHLRDGKLTTEDENKLVDAAYTLSHSDIYIDDNSVIRIPEIYGKCQKLNSELREQGKQLDLVVVDYLQLVTASRESDSRQQDVSAISRGLKQMAGDLHCPVIALSQLSRASVKREASRPVLSDLRESGAIEQDADIVLFLHNTDEIVENETERNVQLIIGKHRNGALGEVALKFDTECGVFMESTDLEE